MGTAYTPLDQVPRSRRRILNLLKHRGRATTMELAGELHVSHEAVRRRLIELVRDGLVKPDCAPEELESPSFGRPPVTYCLTPEGDHFFPKRYDELALLLIDSIREGARDVREALEHVTNERRTRLGASTDGPLKEGLRTLRNVYLQDDQYLEMHRSGDDHLIVEKNCPYLNVALERPAFCSTTVSLMRQILGFEVVREERFQDDDGRCTFHVHTDRPVSARRRQKFEFEPVKTAAHEIDK